MLGFSHQRLREIMDSDCVPLVRSTLNADGKVSLALEARQPGLELHRDLTPCGLEDSAILSQTFYTNVSFSIYIKPLTFCYKEPVKFKFQEQDCALFTLSTRRALRKGKGAVSSFVSGSTAHLYWIDTLCIPIIPTGEPPSSYPCD